MKRLLLIVLPLLLIVGCDIINPDVRGCTDAYSMETQYSNISNLSRSSSS